MPNSSTRPNLEFAAVNKAAQSFLLPMLRRWLPNGRVQGCEYVALNPRRADTHLGSFSINLNTSKWCDFATGDKGVDIISLAAYLFDLGQSEALTRVAQMLGVNDG